MAGIERENNSFGINFIQTLLILCYGDKLMRLLSLCSLLLCLGKLMCGCYRKKREDF